MYELRYELNHRPDWVRIPVAGLVRMLDEELPVRDDAAFGELDIWLARAGRHEELWSKLGAHLVDGGVRFAVWAPNARFVSVVGDWNDWVTTADPLRPVVDSGIWEGIVSTASSGDHYKFHLDGREKADPLAFEAEVPPKNASIVFRSEYSWNDDAWVEARDGRVAARAADDDLRGARAVVAARARLA